MKTLFTTAVILAASITLVAQQVEYEYDAAGNRTGRTVILLSNLQGLKSARHDTAAGLRGELEKTLKLTTLSPEQIDHPFAGHF